MTTFINLTPHDVVVENPDGTRILFPRSGTAARASAEYEACGFEGGVQLYRRKFGSVDLPAPQQGVMYIVSLLVKDLVQRDDLVSPGELIRDENGQPVACRGLVY